MKQLMLLLISFCCFLSNIQAQPDRESLRLHPENPHYFMYQGKPLVIIGSAEHYGAVINRDFDFRTYLKTLGSNQLNHTRLFTGAYIEKLGDFGIQKNTLAPASGKAILPWRRSNQPGYELGGNKFDLTQWDPDYFTRLRDFVELAGRSNVIVEVTLFSAHYGAGWNYSPFNPKNNVNNTDSLSSEKVNTLENGNLLEYQEQYVRKIVRELNPFGNLYFEIQNEPWAEAADLRLIRNEYGPADDWRSTIQVVSQKSEAWQRQVAGWIKDEESRLPNQHLISQNIGNFSYPITEPNPAISIFNFHYASPEAVHRNYYLDKAIGLNETGFAGKDDATYRRHAWRFLMAGGSLFSHLDYSFSVGSEAGQDTSYQAPGGGSPALRKQLGVLKSFFEKLDFIRLQPDLDLVLAAPGSNYQALSDEERLFVVYLEPLAVRNYPLQLKLPKGRTYKAVWHDVVSGEIIGQTRVSDQTLEVPQGVTDKVVVIRRE